MASFCGEALALREIIGQVWLGKVEDDNAGHDYELIAAPLDVELVPGFKTEAWAFGPSAPGTELRVRQGTWLRVRGFLAETFWPGAERLSYYVLLPSLFLHGLATPTALFPGLPADRRGIHY